MNKKYIIGRLNALIVDIEKAFNDAVDKSDADPSCAWTAWSNAYDVIFCESACVAVRKCIEELGWYFEWCDPDMSCEDDVRAYVAALLAFRASRSNDLVDAVVVPKENDLANLEWIEGLPTCPGHWLIEYMIPRSGNRSSITSIKIKDGFMHDGSEQLAGAFPPHPFSPSQARTFVALRALFPGNFEDRDSPTVVNSCLYESDV